MACVALKCYVSSIVTKDSLCMQERWLQQCSRKLFIYLFHRFLIGSWVHARRSCRLMSACMKKYCHLGCIVASFVLGAFLCFNDGIYSLRLVFGTYCLKPAVLVYTKHPHLLSCSFPSAPMAISNTFLSHPAAPVVGPRVIEGYLQGDWVCSQG